MMAAAAPLLRFLLLYGTLYAGFGVQSPYLPLLLQSRGIGPELIGVVLAAGTAMRLAAGPTAGALADRRQARRAVLALSALAAAGLAPAYLVVFSFWPVLALAVAQAAALAPLAPLSDALALAAAAPQRGRGFSYGTVRGAGSAAFILGTLLSGWAVSGFGIAAVAWLNALLLAGAALAASRAPILSLAQTAEAPSLATRGFAALARLAPFRRLVLVAALILGSHAFHDGFAVIRWRAAGIGADMAGLLWSEQVAAEVAVFLLAGPWLLARLGVARAATLAALAGMLRWGVMGATAWLPAMMLVEPLHGLSFALLHLAAMRLLAEIVPPALAATALTLYGTLGIGAATALLSLAAGALYAHLAAEGFWVMAVLCAAALPLALTLREPGLQNARS
jgi:PPP family 3-phenylpropionic acid transporter